MKRPASRAARGFTLIELMMVVAIIGILSSVAIPEFQRLTLRAKQAERHEIMLRIKKAVADTVLQNGKIPGDKITGAFEPALPLAIAKRMPNWKSAGWADIFRSTEEIEGSLYYSYRFLADDTVNPPTLEIWASGDLDGDGAASHRYVRYERRNGLYLTDETDLTCTWVCPPLGQEDDAF
jgi:prepilin-type N-terminal cleavage/methylation domain-containing protein